MTRAPGHLRNVVAVALALLWSVAAVSAPATASSPAEAPSPEAPASSTEFWVSPGGDDSGPGSADRPFATLERARDAVRDLPAAVRSGHDIEIFLRDGTYRMDEPLELEPRDSGRGGHDVIYSAAPGAHPVLTRSAAIPGGSWTSVGGGVWCAPVDPSWDSRQLYVNGVRATRARSVAWPAGFHPVWSDDPLTSGIGFDAGTTPDPSTWTDVNRIEAVNLSQWKMSVVPVAGVQTDGGGGGLVSMQQPAWDNANVFLDEQTGQPGIWSFGPVTWFENAREFLDQPGEWYLDRDPHEICYLPRPGEDLSLAQVELPVGETLVEARGRPGEPVAHLRFEGLEFAYATWLEPNGSSGYVDDQGGFHLVGGGYEPNVIGHVQGLKAIPGSVTMRYARNVTFTGNVFTHLGSGGLWLGTGSQGNRVANNLFTDLSAGAIILGGIAPADAHPDRPERVTRDNVIADNLITDTGREFLDTAAITAGFSRHTRIVHNTIANVPWTGISMGWGWGLLDPSGFLGLPGATDGMWGRYDEPTPNRDSVIADNVIDGFLQGGLWDGGAIYTTGQMGTSLRNGLRIEGNVATGKGEIVRADGLPGIPGGNTFYTDGGTRFVTVKGNLSFDNPVGTVYLGPLDPANLVPYGSDSGGCRTYGDIRFVNNSWLQDPYSQDVATYNFTYQSLMGFAAYSNHGFFDICPYTDTKGVTYPTNLRYKGNQIMPGTAAKVPAGAGVRGRPSTIPEERWVLPT